MTIVEQYRRDRDECTCAEDKVRVWRTYALAYVSHLAARSIGGSTAWVRRSAGDAALPQAYAAYWLEICDFDLLELGFALERNRPK